MLRSDGTVALLGEVVAVPPPPQAVATTANVPKHAPIVRFLSLRNSIWTSCSALSCSSSWCLLPGGPGRECAGNQAYSVGLRRPATQRFPAETAPEASREAGGLSRVR